MIDSASISPYLNCNAGNNHFKDCKYLRQQLEQKLKDTYNLNGFDLFFTPSVTYGMLAIKDALAFGGIQTFLDQGIHYSIIDNIFRCEHSIEESVFKAVIKTHVDPYIGSINNIFSSSCSIGIIDASHSFATNIHPMLIKHADILIAPLHKHASLTIGLSIIAIKTKLNEEFGCLFDRLRLIEKSTMSKEPLSSALDRINYANGMCFNKAKIGFLNEFDIRPDIIKLSNVDSLLPFSCFRHPDFSRLPKNKLKYIGATYFEEFDVLRIARFSRGGISDEPIDFSADVASLLNNCFS